MKVLYKNKTKYTKETYAKYLQFHQNKFGTKYRFITILIIVLLCFLLSQTLSMQIKLLDLSYYWLY